MDVKTRSEEHKIEPDDPRIWRGARRVYFTTAKDFRREARELFYRMVEKERKTADTAKTPDLAFYAYARKDLLHELWEEFDALARKAGELVDHMSWAVMQHIGIEFSMHIDPKLDLGEQGLVDQLQRRCIAENAAIIREHWKGWGHEGDYKSFRNYFDGFEINPEYITQYEMKPLLRHVHYDVPTKANRGE